MDLHGAYTRVIADRAPTPRVCADPFHLIKLANAALDETRRTEWNTARKAAKRRPGRARWPGSARTPPRS